jgi:hypothetical protein
MWDADSAMKLTTTHGEKAWDEGVSYGNDVLQRSWKESFYSPNIF